MSQTTESKGLAAHLRGPFFGMDGNTLIDLVMRFRQTQDYCRILQQEGAELVSVGVANSLTAGATTMGVPEFARLIVKDAVFQALRTQLKALDREIKEFVTDGCKEDKET